MKNTPNAKNKSRTPAIQRFVFVEVPIEYVGPQVALWGEASWWPKNCLWKYIKETEGEVRVGTRYRIKIQKPSAADWVAEVTQLVPNCLIEYTFKAGMFRGYQVIKLEERANGTRVDFALHFRVSGLLNAFLWPFVYQKQYEETIMQVLNALKDNLPQQYQKDQEKGQ